MAKGKKTPELLEQKLARLEEIIASLESGENGLDVELKQYEEGVKLHNECKGLLKEVKLKIKVLTDSLKEDDYE